MREKVTKITDEIGNLPDLQTKLDPRHRYVVWGRILVGVELFFTTDQHYPVLTAGKGNEVRLLLRRAATSSEAAAGGGSTSPSPATTASTEPLENTYWKLIRLGTQLPLRSPSNTNLIWPSTPKLGAWLDQGVATG